MSPGASALAHLRCAMRSLLTRFVPGSTVRPWGAYRGVKCRRGQSPCHLARGKLFVPASGSVVPGRRAASCLVWTLCSYSFHPASRTRYPGRCVENSIQPGIVTHGVSWYEVGCGPSEFLRLGRVHTSSSAFLRSYPGLEDFNIRLLTDGSPCAFCHPGRGDVSQPETVAKLFRLSPCPLLLPDLQLVSTLPVWTWSRPSARFAWVRKVCIVCVLNQNGGGANVLQIYGKKSES